MTVLQDTKDIEKCQPISVARTMLKGAFLGLDFFNRECYAIPYGGSLQFQTDYKGEIKLAKKYSFNPIKDIYAKVVHEGDDFQESIKDGQQTIDFKPIPFNNGEIIGAFAVCLFQDGSMLYETMTKQEIEGIRNNFSKAKNSPAWVKTPGEMYKKTVLRRLCKLIENFRI
jgi:recombination protein RecT